MTELDFTHAWHENETEKIRPKLEEALEILPPLSVDSVRIGRTKSTAGRFVKEREHSHEIYIRLDPEAELFTIVHEFVHHLTREKAVDLYTLAMDKDIADKGSPSYLGSKLAVPSSQENYCKEFSSEELHDLAQEALAQESCEPVVYFEREVKERCEAE